MEADDELDLGEDDVRGASLEEEDLLASGDEGDAAAPLGDIWGGSDEEGGMLD